MGKLVAGKLKGKTGQWKTGEKTLKENAQLEKS